MPSERFFDYFRVDFVFALDSFKAVLTQQALEGLGTIHLRRRHALGGEGSKICQICRRIVLKNCRR